MSDSEAISALGEVQSRNERRNGIFFGIQVCYNHAMILVTGGTGFIGQALIRQLVADGQKVRILVRPSSQNLQLPRGVSVDVVVSSLLDEKGVRAALNNVHTVYHLVGGEAHGAAVDLTDSDINTTEILIRAAVEVGLDRLVYVSHLGADRNSAYPVMKAKGEAEHMIRTAGIPYTIVRSAIVFGPGDHFTESLKLVLSQYPFFFLPDHGLSQLQPIWIDDLATCLEWAAGDASLKNQVVEIGGSEALTFLEIAMLLQQKTGIHKPMVRIKSSYLRWMTMTAGSIRKSFPLSSLWLDYLAEDHTCALDNLPRLFGILPVRFHQKLAYLEPTKKKRFKLF